MCLSIGVVFAIRRAIESARKDAGLKDMWVEMEHPLTPEGILTASGLTPVEMFKLTT